MPQGVHGNGRIICQSHGAAFDDESGDIEDALCLDALPTFAVHLRGGKVFAAGSVAAVKSSKRTPSLCRRSAQDSRTFVIVGGGAAGSAAAEVLREKGFKVCAG
jgi:apoptosis-inducing factor 3